MTERDIQLAIYRYRASIAPFPTLIPNIYLWTWESDLLYISKSRWATEFEIKTSKRDFKNDAGKIRKHQILANGKGPAEFYYVCPPGIITVDDLPEYAGLLWVEPVRAWWGVSEQLSCTIQRRAKRRKTGPLSDKQLFAALTKGVCRYWSLQKHSRNRRPE